MHLDGSVHLATGALAAPLVEAGLASFAPWSRARVSSDPGVDGDPGLAIPLFESAHQRASGASEEDLLARLRARARS